MRLWLGLVLGVLCISCSTTSPLPTGTLHVNEASSPSRTIRVVVLTEDDSRLSEVDQLIADGSRALSRQVGIGLVVSDHRTIRWRSNDRSGVLQQLAGEMRDYDKPFDVALAVHGFGPLQGLRYVTIGNWEGLIDDTYRRFIVLRRMTVQVLLHEICHALIFSADHSFGVRHLMTPMTFYVVPGIFPLNRSVNLQEKDRREILANKWRDFSLPPDIKGRRADPVVSASVVGNEAVSTR